MSRQHPILTSPAGGERQQYARHPVKGVDPQQESQLSALPTFVQNNAWAGFKAGEQQVIRAKGRRCPAREAGDWVSIMIPNADADHQLLQPKRVRLHVTGILQLSGQLDHSFAMIPMQDAQQYRRWAAA